MKQLLDIWTVVYKEIDRVPISYSYTSLEDAKLAKQMIVDSNGGELINECGNVDGCIELEWCYLINGKLIIE